MMKMSEVMDRAKFVRQGAEMVFVCDLSGLEVEDVCKVVRRGEDIVRRMPAKSVLSLTHLGGIKEESKQYARQLLEQIRPHVLKEALSGISDRRSKWEWEGILSTEGDDLRCFERYDDALSWLVQSRAA